tara:strand:- start:284 stop:475 length:192 start_codon:yes stop_codon:yes gene_type:complete
MFKPTDEQMEEWFKPAWEEVNLIMDELNAETKCGLDYMIYMMEQMTESLKSTKKIMDAEGVDN